MSQENVTYVEYTCDGCGKVIAVRDVDAPAFGYHGSVILASELGGTGGDWYAHAASCIRKAVENSIVRDDR